MEPAPKVRLVWEEDKKHQRKASQPRNYTQLTRWWFQFFFYVHPYLGKIPILTNIFQMGWNHPPEIIHTRWFKVTFWSPSWRSLNPLKGSLNDPKKVTLNQQAVEFYFCSFCDVNLLETLSNIFFPKEWPGFWLVFRGGIFGSFGVVAFPLIFSTWEGIF